MPCDFVKLPGGGTAIVCSRGHAVRRFSQKCAYCQNESSLLCDFKVGEGKTCDKPICKRCSVHVGENLDHCRIHSIRGDKES